MNTMPANGIAKSMWITQFVRQKPHTGMAYVHAKCGCLLVCFWRRKAAVWRCRQLCAEHAAMSCQMCAGGERTAWMLIRQLERTRHDTLIFMEDSMASRQPTEEYNLLCHTCFSTRYVRENPNWQARGWHALGIWRE